MNVWKSFFILILLCNSTLALSEEKCPKDTTKEKIQEDLLDFLVERNI